MIDIWGRRKKMRRSHFCLPSAKSRPIRPQSGGFAGADQSLIARRALLLVSGSLVSLLEARPPSTCYMSVAHPPANQHALLVALVVSAQPLMHSCPILDTCARIDNEA